MNASGFPPPTLAGNPRPPPPSWLQTSPSDASGTRRKWGRSTMAPLCRKIVPMPLITFEGSEGCGKSTQVKRRTARLEKCGIAAAFFREAGGTAIGEAIRHFFQHSEENDAMAPETESLF